VKEKIKTLKEREKTTGILIVDSSKLDPDPQLLTQVQTKYPNAEHSRQRVYAQVLTGLKRQTGEEAFSELEQMLPQSEIDNLFGRIS
jgi:hypothetical protein